MDTQNKHRCEIVGVNCEEDGELILTLTDPDDKSFCACPQDYFSDMKVQPVVMGILKTKYGMIWDGSKSSAEALKGKVFYYPLIPMAE